VLLVEQHVRKALRYADRAYIMARGRIQMNLSAASARERIGEIEQTYLAGHLADHGVDGLLTSPDIR
jgi:ABC-type branched-subunit amino acid transport system ATPase component